MKYIIAIAGLVLLLSGSAGAQNLACSKTRINTSGTAGADITVDGTAGGVTVMPALDSRCGAIIQNNGTGTQAMRCGPSTVTVSSTVGWYIEAGKSLILGNEGQQVWKCIKTTGDNAAANVIEAIP